MIPGYVTALLTQAMLPDNLSHHFLGAALWFITRARMRLCIVYEPFIVSCGSEDFWIVAIAFSNINTLISHRTEPRFINKTLRLGRHPVNACILLIAVFA